MASDAPPPVAPATRDPRIRALRLALGAAGAVAPGLGGRAAEAIFCRPPRSRSRAGEDAFLASGRGFTVAAGAWRLRAWEWGGGPTVVLTHGWGSRAGRFAALGPALVAAGFRVVAYDGPAHGASSGFRASLPEFASALRSVAQAAGPVHGVVGHSLGGAAVALALAHGLPARRAVLLAPPAGALHYARRFGELMNVPAPAQAWMEASIERRLALRWADLELPPLVARLRLPALVVHDRDDVDVAWSEGERLARAWPGAAFETTTGLGHRALLRDPGVVRRVVGFLADGGGA